MSIADNWVAVRKLIQEAEIKYQRPRGSVSLLAVTKSQSVGKIIEAIECGQIHFGENYLQEAIMKIKSLQQYSLNWHFIGRIQANKTRAIAENFSWVHSVSRYTIAKRLHQQRPDRLGPLNVCVQVNIDHDPQKQGASINELPELMSQLLSLKKLTLRGLMVIPSGENNFSKQRQVYRQLAVVQQFLVGQGFRLDTLSMGMSPDFEAAIAEGSTIVRLGTAIFGERR